MRLGLVTSQLLDGCYYLSALGVLAVMSLSSCYIGSLTLLALPSGPRGGLEALSKVFCAGGVACAGHREENLWPLPAPQASPGGREGLGLNCRVWSLIASALSPAFGGGCCLLSSALVSKKEMNDPTT